MKAYEDHCRRTGEQVSHPLMKEMLAGLAAAEADKLFESKGLDYLDREKARQRAIQQAHHLAEQQYGPGGVFNYQASQYGQGGYNGPPNQYGQGGYNVSPNQYGQGGFNGPPNQYGQGGFNGPPNQYGQGGFNGPPNQYGQGGFNGPPNQYGQGGFNGPPNQFGNYPQQGGYGMNQFNNPNY
jgi:hypothetical protein